jgi:hypothetical protein
MKRQSRAEFMAIPIHSLEALVVAPALGSRLAHWTVMTARAPRPRTISRTLCKRSHGWGSAHAG